METVKDFINKVIEVKLLNIGFAFCTIFAGWATWYSWDAGDWVFVCMIPVFFISLGLSCLGIIDLRGS